MDDQSKENKFVTITRKTFEIITSSIIAIFQGISNAVKKNMKRK